MGSYYYLGDVMKKIQTDYLTVWIFALVMFISGMFVGYVADRIVIKGEFKHEFVVKVQPQGLRPYPYRPNNLYFTTLPEELHKVIIRNGLVVDVQRVGYAYQED